MTGLQWLGVAVVCLPIATLVIVMCVSAHRNPRDKWWEPLAVLGGATVFVGLIYLGVALIKETLS